MRVIHATQRNGIARHADRKYWCARGPTEEIGVKLRPNPIGPVDSKQWQLRGATAHQRICRFQDVDPGRRDDTFTRSASPPALESLFRVLMVSKCRVIHGNKFRSAPEHDKLCVDKRRDGSKGIGGTSTLYTSRNGLAWELCTRILNSL